VFEVAKGIMVFISNTQVGAGGETENMNGLNQCWSRIIHSRTVMKHNILELRKREADFFNNVGKLILFLKFFDK
jgi:hypothetical protein